jgi:hypothetical protein
MVAGGSPPAFALPPNLLKQIRLSLAFYAGPRVVRDIVTNQSGAAQALYLCLNDECQQFAHRQGAD